MYAIPCVVIVLVICLVVVYNSRGNVRNGERNDCDRDRNGSGI